LPCFSHEHLVFQPEPGYGVPASAGWSLSEVHRLLICNVPTASYVLTAPRLLTLKLSTIHFSAFSLSYRNGKRAFPAYALDLDHRGRPRHPPSHRIFHCLGRSKSSRLQNKSLYAWTDDLQKAQQNYSDPDSWKKVEAANTAIRAIGTNALPFVMADIRARVTIKVRVVNWLAPHATFLKLQPIKVEDRWRRAIRALEALGPIANPCLPELVALTQKRVGYTEDALMAVGPDAIPAFTDLLVNSKYPQTGNLIGALANSVYSNRIKPERAAVILPYLAQVFRSSDTHGGWYAAQAFGAIHQDPDLCVPLLVDGLTNSTASFRAACAHSLGAFGAAAAPHATRLADLFDHTDLQTRTAICQTMANFDAAAEIAVPVLVRGLSDTNGTIRIFSASGLGQLGVFPDQVVPPLIDAAQDRNATVRVMAVQSLGMFISRPTNALAAIQRACLDRDPSVRNTATNALKRFGH
jgi:HEAT repeats